MYEDIAIWKQDFTLTHYFVDPDGCASIHGLAFFLQDAAHNHANARSLGFEDLLKDKKAWVLTRQFLKIYHFPVIGQEIRVETWVESTSPSFSTRDFHILTREGDIAGICRTSWMMLDIIQRRPVKIPGYVLERIPLTPGRLNENLLLEKLPLSGDSQDNNSFSVQYSDLDMNNHVNNITYVRWVSDGFDAGFRKKYRLSSLEMNYLSEALYGDRLTCQITPESSPDSFGTLIRRVSDQRDIAVSRTFWKEKN